MAMLVIGCSGAGSKALLSSSLVILISRSGVGALVGSGRVEMEMGRGSTVAGNSCHDRTFKFLQELCIPLSVLSPGGLPVPG